LCRAGITLNAPNCSLTKRCLSSLSYICNPLYKWFKIYIIMSYWSSSYLYVTYYLLKYVGTYR
jgi:hypothetical protein